LGLVETAAGKNLRRLKEIGIRRHESGEGMWRKDGRL
jgi:hypothetical protein